jgi:transposase
MPNLKKEELRAAFVYLKQKGKRIGAIANLFDVQPRTVSNAVKRFEDTSSNKNRKGQGRRRSARDEENAGAAAIAIALDPSTKKHSTRRLARMMSISRKS